MIKYNNSNINDWYFDTSNIIKVYRNNAVCYYKVGGTPPAPTAQTPCYAVVENISQYSDTEFEDVYDKTTEKWYKLNNLNNYEEYGVYGTGRTITHYDGKLTIDDGYEYQYTGGSWVNVGEVSGSSTTIKSPEYIERTSSYNGYCSLLEYLTEDTKIIVKHKQTNGNGSCFIGDNALSDSNDWRVFFFGSTLYYDFISQRQSTSRSMPMADAEEWEIGNYYIKNTATDTYYINSTTQTFSSRPSPMYIYHLDDTTDGSDFGQVWYIKIYRGSTLIRDFIPWTDMSGNYGLYDKVENELVHTVGNMTASTTINDVEVGGGYAYPLEYVVREDPPDNLVFSSMEEAEEYECPWYGMSALIAGEDYMFCEGNEWLTKYSYVEVAGDYICDNGDKYKKMQEYDRQADGTMSPTSNYVKGDLIESGSPDCPQHFDGKWIAYYADESVAYSAECSSSTAITKTEVRSGSYQQYKKVIIGDCVNRVREAFQQCTSMTDLEIGTGVTEDLYYAFEDCTALTAATWYATGLTNSQDGGFQRCSSLQKLVMYSTSVPNVSITFFRNVPSTLIIYVPDSAISAYQSKANWGNYTIKGHSELPT